jgi:hypothetical protein
MKPKFRWIGLATTSLLLLGCNGGAESSRARGEVPNVEPYPGSGTAAEMLVGKVNRTSRQGPARQDLAVDSTTSAATDELRFYWTRVAGRSFHEFQMTSIASYRGRFFDPEDLSAWRAIWGDWVPGSEDEALNICLEAVALGVTNTPNRLQDRDLLQAGTADRLVNPADRDRLHRVDLVPVIESSVDTEGQWRVWFWYPDLYRPGKGRLATRYRCDIPGPHTGDGLRIVEADARL